MVPLFVSRSECSIVLETDTCWTTLAITVGTKERRQREENVTQFFVLRAMKLMKSSDRKPFLTRPAPHFKNKFLSYHFWNILMEARSHVTDKHIVFRILVFFVCVCFY